MSHWIWRFLGWVIAISVGAGGAYWVYWKQSNKGLAYKVVSISPLGPLQARGFADLKLFKGDKPIENPFLITVRFANVGDVNIEPSDFATSIEIRPLARFGREREEPSEGEDRVADFKRQIFIASGAFFEGMFPARVVDARIAGTSPVQIPVDLRVAEDVLRIHPLLLNAGDEITIEMLISGRVNVIEVRGRISGVKKILEERHEESVPASKKAQAGLLVALIAMIIGVFTSVSRKRIPHKVGRRIVNAISDVAAFICTLALVYVVAVASFGSWEFIVGILGAVVMLAGLASYVTDLQSKSGASTNSSQK